MGTWLGHLCPGSLVFLYGFFFFLHTLHQYFLHQDSVYPLFFIQQTKPKRHNKYAKLETVPFSSSSSSSVSSPPPPPHHPSSSSSSSSSSLSVLPFDISSLSFPCRTFVHFSRLLTHPYSSLISYCCAIVASLIAISIELIRWDGLSHHITPLQHSTMYSLVLFCTFIGFASQLGWIEDNLRISVAFAFTLSGAMFAFHDQEGAYAIRAHAIVGILFAGGGFFYLVSLVMNGGGGGGGRGNEESSEMEREVVVMREQRKRGKEGGRGIESRDNSSSAASSSSSSSSSPSSFASTPASFSSSPSSSLLSFPLFVSSSLCSLLLMSSGIWLYVLAFTLYIPFTTASISVPDHEAHRLLMNLSWTIGGVMIWMTMLEIGWKKGVKKLREEMIGRMRRKNEGENEEENEEEKEEEEEREGEGRKMVWMGKRMRSGFHPLKQIEGGDEESIPSHFPNAVSSSFPPLPIPSSSSSSFSSSSTLSSSSSPSVMDKVKMNLMTGNENAYNKAVTFGLDAEIEAEARAVLEMDVMASPEPDPDPDLYSSDWRKEV